MFRKLFGRESVTQSEWDGETRLASQQKQENNPVPVPWSTSGTVLHDGMDKWEITASSLAEAKLAKREIRARQKELRIQKRELSAAQTQIRAEYRQKNANRGMTMRGGGNVGKFVRAIDQANRASDRRNREGNLAPYDRAKLEIDAEINTLDRLLIMLDQAIESMSEQKE